MLDCALCESNAGLCAARPPPTVLNFFKPISNGTAKKSVQKRAHVQMTQKRALPQAAQQPLKRPCMNAHDPIDLVSSDKQPEMRAPTPPDYEADIASAPSNGHYRQHGQSHILSTADQWQHVHPDGLAGVSDGHVQDAALSSSVPVIAQTVQEEQVQRSNSSIDPSMAPVRRFKGVPYAPDAGSIQFLTNMGFTHEQATRALKVTQGNIERAANWLLSGM